MFIIIISTDEDPSLRMESSAIINLRGVSTKLNKYNTMSVVRIASAHNKGGGGGGADINIAQISYLSNFRICGSGIPRSVGLYRTIPWDFVIPRGILNLNDRPFL